MAADEPIAIVGIGGLFPGAASLDALWKNIVERRDAAREVPPDRWFVDVDEIVGPFPPAPDRAYATRGCFLDDPFDLGPAADQLDLYHETNALDPLVRLVLRVGAEAWADGITDGLDRSRVGIVLANIALPTDASSRLTRTLLGRLLARRATGLVEPLSSHAPLGTHPLNRYVTGLPAGRLAQALRLGGGALTLDAACASSLYALHLACEALRAGQTDAMLAGGVSRPECLYTQIGFSQLRALSPSGRCAPFDRRADGLLVGEGAGVFLLKRLADALTAGDRIHGLIRSVGLSNDVGGSLLAPDTEGQQRAMRQAHERAGLDPSQMGYVECHGTGTPRGDAVELASLAAVWGAGAHPMVIGSVKANVGHLLTAAGAAGLTKVLLAIRHRTLPPNANFDPSTAMPELAEGPFRVLTEPRPWDADGPRRAGISAFGFGGINAHLIVEEWVERPPTPRASVSISATHAPLAIVGLGAHFGDLDSLGRFQRAVLSGQPALRPRPAERFYGVELNDGLLPLGGPAGPMPGAWIDRLQIPRDRFRIPPREIPGILPQQLLMLQVATDAFEDAGLDPRRNRPRLRSGVLVGMGLDLETTRFCLGWGLRAMARRWLQQLGQRLDPEPFEAWLRDLRRALGPGLDANRTVGALGGIIASRIARELRLGGPSFAVSSEDASGATALEVATGLLRRRELDVALVGAVDLAGDVRTVLATGALRPWSPSGIPRPFDARADGPVVGEGAAALVLKRLDDARRDGDRIYALLRSVATARSWQGALGRAYEGSRLDPATVSYVEGHGSGAPDSDRQEAQALIGFFPRRKEPRCALGSARSVIGDTGAASALAGVVKTALALFDEVLPAIPDFQAPVEGPGWNGSTFHVPRAPQAWHQDPADGPRRAGVNTCSVDGSFHHVVLEGVEQTSDAPAIPSGPRSAGVLPTPTHQLDTVHNGVEMGRDQGVEIKVGGPALQPPKLSDVSPSPHAIHSVAEATRNLDPRDPQVCTASPTREIKSLAPLIHRAGKLTIDQLQVAQATASAHGRFLELSSASRALQVGITHMLTGTHSASTSGQHAPTPPRKSKVIAPPPRQTERSSTPPPRQTELSPLPAAAPTISAAAAIAKPRPRTPPPIAFDRAQCMELAVGSLARVLGPSFAEVDTFPTRVRLPDEPLMLVDRIVEVRGEPGSLGAGSVVTEHDVAPNAWYLDGGRAPVCISVEAGQADLFLSGYLGIDRAVRGLRVYRLLDAEVVFHRDLPAPGETIRYQIHIDRFMRQGSTWLFLFRFEGRIDGERFITMRNGCAGFFSPEQLATGRGLVEEDPTAIPPRRSGTTLLTPWVPMTRATLDEAQLNALRRGDLEACFGPAFAGRTLAPSLRLPTDRMCLIHRIVDLDPEGGSYGLGTISGETDVHPEAWYLTCHFVDDPVMPGTLMYEGCLHTLRVYLCRLGLVVDRSDGDLHYGPLPGQASALRCRGQVVASTKKVRYRIDIKELGYDPEPYVLADAVMFADDAKVVRFRNVAYRIRGLSQAAIASGWRAMATSRPPQFDRDHILTFATGNPSQAFGEPYRIFDHDRIMARLPGPPYSFIDRIVSAPMPVPPFALQTTGWIESEWEVDPNAWFFAASRGRSVPFAVILESGLQPCGWLAAYLGAALRSKDRLCFRNLEGQGILHADLRADVGTVTARVRLNRVSEAGGMILLSYDLELKAGLRLLYEAQTRFGFFTPDSLAQQAGIRDAASRLFCSPLPAAPRFLEIQGPKHPDEIAAAPPSNPERLELPDRVLLMIDRIDDLQPTGGPAGLGYIRGSLNVDPDAWFFTAHFYQDPVIPGSLGLESFLQLLRLLAIERWPERVETHRFEPIAVGREHAWTYRGQVLPTHERVEIAAWIERIEGHRPDSDLVPTSCARRSCPGPKTASDRAVRAPAPASPGHGHGHGHGHEYCEAAWSVPIEEGEAPVLIGSGFLSADGLPIYEMKRFALRLVRI